MRLDAECSEEQGVLEPPHPAVVRDTRVRAGISVEACTAAAGFRTKASWYLVERGKNRLPAWRWRMVLKAIEAGDYKRSHRPVARVAFVPSALDPLAWVGDDRRVSIGMWLRALREALGMSPTELAAAARINIHTLGSLEAGSSKRYLTTKRLCVLLVTLRGRQTRMREALTLAVQAEPVDGSGLRSTRVAFGISQATVGAWVGFSSIRKGAMISAYERGLYAIPGNVSAAFLRKCGALLHAVDESTCWHKLHREIRQDCALETPVAFDF